MSSVYLTAQTLIEPGSGIPVKSDDNQLNSALGKDIKGTWSWGTDKEEYDGAGNGTYWRVSKICYKFTYRIKDNIIHTTADRNHSCGATKENDWKISIINNKMYKEHSGSGYKTEWIRGTDKPANSGPLAKQIIGKWQWGSDTQEYYANGQGKRSNYKGFCSNFTYTIDGDIITTIEDRDSNCLAKRENGWKTRVENNMMYKEHTGSKFQTEWKRID